MSTVRHTIHDLICPIVIGVNPNERQARQETRTTITIETNDLEHSALAGRIVVKHIFESIYHSEYLTLEALASYIAKYVLSVVSNGTAPAKVSVSTSKPHALSKAASAEVVIHREASDYQEQEPEGVPNRVDSLPSVIPAATVGSTHAAVLAIGTNLGDRFHNIEYAVRLLEIPGEVLHEVHPHEEDASSMTLKVIDTSFLYETEPMYVTDQPKFINGACVVKTNLSPLTLLRLVKAIETIVGRIPSIRNGPRAVDLDIIFYDTLIYDTRPTRKRQSLDDLEGQLLIPHPRIAERLFVLRPLNDMIPEFVHPALKKSVRTLLQQLDDQPDADKMRKAIPFPLLPLSSQDTSPYPSIPPVPRTASYWTFTSSPPMPPKDFRTQIMATLNTTPDSFSDGSTHNTLSTGLEYVRNAVSAGASIVDIGGYSTRPGAKFVSVEEEIDRVVPYVKAIRTGEAHKDVLISVDTFRPQVAEAAVVAGANCINDVYAFTGKDSFEQGHDEEAKAQADSTMQEMKRIARQYATPVVLMHSRGDAGSHKDYSAYNYAGTQNAVIEGIRNELGAKVSKIVRGEGAVRRWSIIIDPGVGFSKTVEENLQILRNADRVTADQLIGKEETKQHNPLAKFPQLIGVSRKSFLGTILAQDEGGRETAPKERDWATAAAVSCAIQQGAIAVRVHNVEGLRDVVKVADALWRTQ
ncbi:hypothetical protein EST38_g8198 [Candolleomyces aberdarensis]|uniref:Pterin-binding domain-containing protein n=1 Tax=Candolleomyces aberdarensis TaxID=2316362 RepID=A0A4Q2DDT7_9AGAR|nr:hypothetical protein EST38_g8198 [Candolleomyces aberdarensis]